MKDENDDNSTGLVLLGLICLGMYWLFKKCTVNSRNRTVLVPVDQLNQHAHADPEQLSQLEAIAVSNVSKDFLGVEAAIHSSGRFRKFVTVLVVLVLAVAMWQFPHRYFTEPNHYNTLQVERSTASSDIKRAFRTMSLKLHPDKVPESEKAEAEGKFIIVKEAYDALGKPANRETYERHGLAGLECKLDKSSMCNVNTGDGNPYLMHDIMGLFYYFSVSLLVICATGNQCVSWSTQLGVIAMFGTTFLMEMSLRGALGMESRDWDASLGFDEFTNYQKAITCRGWFLFVLSGALVVGALAKGPSTEDVNRSYFNAILLQQSNMMNRIQNQDATIEALTTKLKGK
jgi:hypothetical protein